MRDITRQTVNYLKLYLPSLRRCKNNNKVWVANECLFCDGIGNRAFRYNTKFKIIKCFNCGFGVKELRRLKELHNDFIRYYEWLEELNCTNYRRSKEKCWWEIDDIENGYDLPF